MPDESKNGKLHAYLEAVRFSCEHPNVVARSHRDICKFHDIDEKAVLYAIERAGLVKRLENSVGWEGWLWMGGNAIYHADVMMVDDYILEYRVIGSDPRKVAQEKNQKAEQAMEFFRQVSEDAKKLVEKIEKLAELVKENAR